MTRPATPRLSIVVPCCNEEAVIKETARRLQQVAGGLRLSHEIIFVDDGSRDRTFEILRGIQAASRTVRVIRLSRNFGQQVATTAGLARAAGDAVVLIDADLQDPPEVISELVERWREGWDVVYAVRAKRAGETLFKRLTARLFYRLINVVSTTPIPVDTGDFRLMDRKVVDALLAMPERDRLLRAMVSWVGFRQTGVTYSRAERLHGKTKYPLSRMIRLAADGVLSFSVAPLKLATVLGFASCAVAAVGAAAAVWKRVWMNESLMGWIGLFLAVLFLGGVQLICLGIIGAYLGRTYGEVKHRPLYLVQERLGFPGLPVRRTTRSTAAGPSRRTGGVAD